MSEQPGIFEPKPSQSDAAMALFRAALEQAAEDGSWDKVSDRVRSFIGQIFLPPAGGAEAVIRNAMDEAAWHQAIAESARSHLDRCAEIADRIPGHSPVRRYNSRAYLVRDIGADLDAIEAALSAARDQARGGE